MVNRDKKGLKCNNNQNWQQNKKERPVHVHGLKLTSRVAILVNYKINYLLDLYNPIH